MSVPKVFVYFLPNLRNTFFSLSVSTSNKSTFSYSANLHHTHLYSGNWSEGGDFWGPGLWGSIQGLASGAQRRKVIQNVGAKISTEEKEKSSLRHTVKKHEKYGD